MHMDGTSLNKIKIEYIINYCAILSFGILLKGLRQAQVTYRNKHRLKFLF